MLSLLKNPMVRKLLWKSPMVRSLYVMLLKRWLPRLISRKTSNLHMPVSRSSGMMMLGALVVAGIAYMMRGQVSTLVHQADDSLHTVAEKLADQMHLSEHVHSEQSRERGA